jgi:hypothetical protein
MTGIVPSAFRGRMRNLGNGFILNPVYKPKATKPNGGDHFVASLEPR